MSSKPRCEWCKRPRGEVNGNLCAKCRVLWDAGVRKGAVKRFFRENRDAEAAKKSKPRQVGIIQAGGQRRVGDSQAVYRKRRSFKRRRGTQ
jgi:hypothetical protein